MQFLLALELLIASNVEDESTCILVVVFVVVCISLCLFFPLLGGVRFKFTFALALGGNGNLVTTVETALEASAMTWLMVVIFFGPKA